MLVVVATDQILNCDCVCQGCLFADRQGRPRWQGGRLGCAVAMADPRQGHIFECQMGFRVVNVDWEAGSTPQNP